MPLVGQCEAELQAASCLCCCEMRVRSILMKVFRNWVTTVCGLSLSRIYTLHFTIKIQNVKTGSLQFTGGKFNFAVKELIFLMDFSLLHSVRANETAVQSTSQLNVFCPIYVSTSPHCVIQRTHETRSGLCQTPLAANSGT